MDSRVLKSLSHVAFAAGMASVVVSGLTFFLARKEAQKGERNTGQFIGLWAPTFFTLAEMLDRISVEDSAYLGIPIERAPENGAVQKPAPESMLL